MKAVDRTLNGIRHWGQVAAILVCMRAYSYIIWFIGSAVWWLVAALAIHHGERQRALVSLGIAVVFFFSGMFFQRNMPKL